MNTHLKEIIDATRRLVPNAVALACSYRANGGGGLTLSDVLLTDGTLLGDVNGPLWSVLELDIDADLSWLTDGTVNDSEGGDAVLYMDGTSEPWDHAIQNYLEQGRAAVSRVQP